MMTVSGVNIGALQSLIGASKALDNPEVQKEEPTGRPLKPVTDEYIRSEKQEPSGRYWMGRDEAGQPKIFFDDPERTADATQNPEDVIGAKHVKTGAPEAKEPEKSGGAKGPEKGGEKEEHCAGNTDKVDREIEKLKKKQQELKQRLSTETDEAKAKDLERKLAQVERELKQKDNDTYRKQHTTFTQL